LGAVIATAAFTGFCGIGLFITDLAGFFFPAHEIPLFFFG
jgi:hypothetical protein